MASRRAVALQVLSLNVIGHTASKQTGNNNGNIRHYGPMRCCIDPFVGAASGDPGWGYSERKFKFRGAGGCEVERKWKKGEYEERVKCKPGRYGYGYRYAFVGKHGCRRGNASRQRLARMRSLV